MKLHKMSDGRVMWHCPGCDEAHAVTVTGGSAWKFNGDMERPTFTPSVLVTYSTPTGYSNENPAPVGYDGPRTEHRCHSFVTDGKMMFLDDCTHALKGQLVEIPEVEA